MTSLSPSKTENRRWKLPYPKLPYPKLGYPRLGSLKNLPRYVGIRKPPQIVRWDLLGVFLSYLWGTINSMPLPPWMRVLVYRAWAFTFRVNLHEVPDPLHEYPTLRDFFSRPLKEGVRTVAPEGLASPVDGRVVIFGEIQDDRVEQVKGATYPINCFLGEKDRSSFMHAPSKKKLYHCVLYLAPGDYHRFHSPVEWKIKERRHFPGTLFPISPSFARWIPNLFALNERVVLSGEWQEGFYSLAAVGAYNVGSIALNFDKALNTNAVYRDWRCPNLEFLSWNGLGTYNYNVCYDEHIDMSRGEEIGHFNLGSTIVLVFECDEFEFNVKPGQRVLMGEKLGQVLHKEQAD